MMNLVTGVVGIVLVGLFLGFMVWWIKEVPLTLIVLGVMALLAYDFVLSLRSGNGPDRG